MAGCYLVTGVQLGMLVGIENLEDRKALIEEIDKKQYIGYSNDTIEKDCGDIRTAFEK